MIFISKNGNNLKQKILGFVDHEPLADFH